MQLARLIVRPQLTHTVNFINDKAQPSSSSDWETLLKVVSTSGCGDAPAIKIQKKKSKQF